MVAKVKPVVDKVDKVDKDKGGLDWIPKTVEKVSSSDLTAKLNIRYLKTSLDKFQRQVMFWVLSNPEALNIIKEDVENNGLEIDKINLPFFVGTDGDYLIRVLKHNCKLTDDELEFAKLGVEQNVTFKMYVSGKSKSAGYTIHF